MAKRQKRGMDSIDALEANQREVQSTIQRLREQLEEAERKEKENASKLRDARIRDMGESIQPYVVRFNKLNFNIFDFLDDVSGALERGDAVLVSGKEYRKTQEHSSTSPVAEPSEDTQIADTDGEDETDVI